MVVQRSTHFNADSLAAFLPLTLLPCPLASPTARTAPHHLPPQETAAAATGHAKQYELLAKTSEDALRSMRGDHDKFKQEAGIRCVRLAGSRVPRV